MEALISFLASQNTECVAFSTTDTAADRLHTSTVDPLPAHHAILPSHSIGPNLPRRDKTPLPNTALVFAVSPTRYRARLFYQHSPVHPWLQVTTPLCVCQQPRLGPWRVNVCHAVVPSRRSASGSLHRRPRNTRILHALHWPQ
jgi:hypothetical protein